MPSELGHECNVSSSPYLSTTLTKAIPMYSLLISIACIVTVVLLFQINSILGIVFFIATIVTVPALMLHRRELASGIEYESDQESNRHGLLQLARTLGLDATGIALGSLILILIALFARLLGGHLGR